MTCWRRRRDSNPRDPFGSNGFQDRRFQPLTHSSVSKYNLRQLLGGILQTALESIAAFWCLLQPICNQNFRVSRPLSFANQDLGAFSASLRGLWNVRAATPRTSPHARKIPSAFSPVAGFLLSARGRGLNRWDPLLRGTESSGSYAGERNLYP